MKTRKQLFTNLYMTYSPSLYIYAKRYVDNPEVREDIICDVFARLWHKGDAFMLDKTTALAYLRTCVRNACLNYLRSRGSEESFFAEQIRIPAYADSPESIYTIDEMYSMLYAAVNKLSSAEKTVFYESFMMEKKEADVASALGVSGKTVERYRKKIMDFLKAELKDAVPSVEFGK